MHRFRNLSERADEGIRNALISPDSFEVDSALRAHRVVSELGLCVGPRRLPDTMHEACAAAHAAADTDGYAQSNRNFHSAIIAGTHNPDLVDCVEMCRLRIAPYQRLQFALSSRRGAAQGEHAEVLSALERHASDEAAAAMRAYLSAAAIAIDQQLRRAGWY